jgi:iron complex transport system permease protein
MTAPASAPEHSPRQASGAFPTARDRRRTLVLLVVLTVAAAGFAFGLLAYDNPMEVGTRGFWLIAKRRATSIVVMAVVALCQAVATVAFQTVTNNRIITPGIMGFESLYIAIQTSAVYFFGMVGLTSLMGTGMFVVQLVAMVALSALLYGWLLSGKYANLQIMLLIGIIIGGGLGSISTFMQRLLTPSEFDVLTARMFGSISSAKAEYLPIAIPLCLVAAGGLFLVSRRLNVLALGAETAGNLGLNHRRHTIGVLLLVSVLMATSTALVGPMTFFGFLVATLAYQAAGTHDHRVVLPMAFLQGVVSIIIELVGGSVFLVVILRKGRL